MLEQDTELGAAVAAILASRPSFAVGDRVRVLARPECRYCRECHDREVGLTGRVDAIGHRGRTYHADEATAADLQAHPIWVEFDEPFDACGLSHFAPTELELLP